MLAQILYTARIIESERGWGRRVDGVRNFKTAKGRDNFIKKFNAKNDAPSAPDWYMFAEKGEDIIRRPKRKRK